MVGPESKTELIYLIGMPGCGKSTLGRQLARKMQLDFVDLDERIERKAQKNIPDIFSEKGENFFRELEKQAVIESSKLKNSVIATGGGAACFFNNIDVMNSVGTTVYIKVSAKELFRRLYSLGQKNRPLLAGKSDEELFIELTEKLTHRNQFYEQSDIVLANDNLQVDELLNALR